MVCNLQEFRDHVPLNILFPNNDGGFRTNACPVTSGGLPGLAKEKVGGMVRQSYALDFMLNSL